MYSVQDIHLYLFLTVIEIEYRERELVVSWVCNVVDPDLHIEMFCKFPAAGMLCINSCLASRLYSFSWRFHNQHLQVQSQ